MADLSDVEARMVSIIADSLHLGHAYLAGSSVASPVARSLCRVYRGWPSAAALDADMANGVANITVFPVAGSTRRTTRYFSEWHDAPAETPLFTATVDGTDVIFAGTAQPNYTVGIAFGVGIQNQAFTYRLTADDTPFTVAAVLGQAIPQSTVSGPIVTLPTTENLVVRVAADHSMWMEVRRQEQQIWVTTWSPTPDVRDAVTAAVDRGFAGLTRDDGHLTDQFPLPDGSSARIQYISNHTDDIPQRQNLWRRDLRFVVSYPTTITSQFPEMVFGNVFLTEEISQSTIITIVGSGAD